jgi:hypothetical protein
VDTLKETIHQYAETGTVSANLGNIMTDFGGFIKKELTDSFSNVKTQADKLSADFPIAGDLIKGFQRMTGTLPPTTNSSIPSGNVGTNSMNGSQPSTQKSTMDVNVNHTINITAPPGIDTKTLQTALNEPDIKQQIVKMYKDTMSDTIGRPMPSKNEPR